MTKFTEFYLLVKELHCLPDEINFTTSYTDPRNGDLLPINNDDNLLRAYSTAMPLLRLFIYREQGKWSAVKVYDEWNINYPNHRYYVLVL